MILTTGGRASGATSTRSRPRSCAAASASSIASTPSCWPSSAIARTGLMRIIRLIRVRGCLLVLLLSGGGSFSPFPLKEKADSSRSRVRECVIGCRLPVLGRGRARPMTENRELTTPSLSRTLERFPAHRKGLEVGRHRRPLGLVPPHKLRGGHGLHKSEALPVPPQPPHRHRGIMLETDPPPIRLGALVHPAPRFECHERLQVIPHDPRQRQVGGGRHEIGDEVRHSP